MNKPQVIEHIAESVNFSVFDVKWIPNTAKFMAIGAKSTGSGILTVMEMNENKVDLVQTIETNKALKCSSFGANGIGRKHVALGDFVGQLSVMDLDTKQPVFSVSEAHNDIINCLDAIGGTSIDCGAPEIVTGSRDGSVKVWDVRQKDCPVACMTPASESEGGGFGSRDCWAVTFGNSFNNYERSVVAGYDNGDLKIFDLRKMDVLWETNLKNGICGLEFDRKDIKMNKLCATTLEGGLHVFDMRTFHPKKGFTYLSEKDAGKSLGTNGVVSGSKSTVWTVKHLPQNRDILATCSGSGSIRLWKYQYPEKRTKPGPDGKDVGVVGNLELLRATTLSTQPVHSFDWNLDMTGLAVCGSFDQTIRVLITTRINSV